MAATAEAATRSGNHTPIPPSPSVGEPACVEGEGWLLPFWPDCVCSGGRLALASAAAALPSGPSLPRAWVPATDCDPDPAPPPPAPPSWLTPLLPPPFGTSSKY